jgi:PRTase ComF-like
MQQTYSLHKINSADNFGFSPTKYSKFKYGDDSIAREFGNALAESFIENYLSKTPILEQIVVISSPYAFIPTATFGMKNYFVFRLNRWLAENDLPVVQETKVTRSITYKEDYGELDEAQRLSLIGNDTFQIDKDFLKNKVLIFLDDIRITGSHERMITKMLKEYHLENETHLLYFAELVNRNIHPNIENFLNYYHVKSIFDLDNIIKNERFSINTRIVKYILNSEPNSFKIFIQNHSDSFLELLYNMAIGNSYLTIEAYQENLKTINSELNLREKNTVYIF